jgi:hypothetical protein
MEQSLSRRPVKRRRMRKNRIVVSSSSSSDCDDVTSMSSSSDSEDDRRNRNSNSSRSAEVEKSTNAVVEGSSRNAVAEEEGRVFSNKLNVGCQFLCLLCGREFQYDMHAYHLRTSHDLSLEKYVETYGPVTFSKVRGSWALECRYGTLPFLLLISTLPGNWEFYPHKICSGVFRVRTGVSFLTRTSTVPISFPDP